MAASSTPIRISSGSASGGNESPTLMSASLGQKSSSVPTAGSTTTNTGGSHLQLQQMGSSNQSLGIVQMGVTGTSSITPPNSAGLRSTTAFDFKIKRRSSLKVLMRRLPSSDSLSNSPVQTSPGIVNWNSADNKSDGNQTDKVSSDATKLNRKESYKAQRKNYRREKKRVASELMNSLQDPAVIVLADWLKVRGTLKSWTKLWCVLKPGLLLIYKSPKTKSSHWVGTVLLTSCQVIERPSKKDGFCFKIFHPMEQSIWAPKGPEKETIGAVVQPLPTAYLIFRAPSQAAGKCWMDALELSLRCSALLLRSANANAFTSGDSYTTDSVGLQITTDTQWSEADYEKHFNEQDLEGADSCNEKNVLSDNESDSGSDNEGAALDDNQQEEDEEEEEVEAEVEIKETIYMPVSEGEIVTEAGETVEELAEEHKGLIWHLVKQVRPGMDLSKVVLPTFILEPRSFLDKLSDSYYHADLLSRAVNEDDPFTRMKTVVQWYLSGFYKKPKGLKKPYNPILGEVFRCYWEHPNGSRTYYIAEQVSHHPPISAFYVTNRQDGFSISCSILARSKFYGNSTSAVLEGVATLTLLPRGESYTLTTPYAHCKGILMGTLSMELGGKIQIECINTGYKTDLEFKLKSLLGNSDSTNGISGKIKLGKEVLASISGHWDREMFIKDTKTNEETVLFAANSETKAKRLVRYMVPLEHQMPNESERLWNAVTLAIKRNDQNGATDEKTVLEEAQRKGAKERKALGIEWEPYLFKVDEITGQWQYKYADLRPWDPRNDVKQYETDCQVLTKSQLKAPKLARTTSLVSRQSLGSKLSQNAKAKANHKYADTDSSIDNVGTLVPGTTNMNKYTAKSLTKSLDLIKKTLDDHSKQLETIKKQLDVIQRPVALGHRNYSQTTVQSFMHRYVPESVPESTVLKAVALAFVGILLCLVFKWLAN